MLRLAWVRALDADVSSPPSEQELLAEEDQEALLQQRVGGQGAAKSADGEKASGHHVIPRIPTFCPRGAVCRAEVPVRSHEPLAGDPRSKGAVQDRPSDRMRLPETLSGSRNPSPADPQEDEECCTAPGRDGPAPPALQRGPMEPSRCSCGWGLGAAAAAAAGLDGGARHPPSAWVPRAPQVRGRTSDKEIWWGCSVASDILGA